jgi:PAS domain S-box-containing protein
MNKKVISSPELTLQKKNTLLQQRVLELESLLSTQSDQLNNIIQELVINEVSCRTQEMEYRQTLDSLLVGVVVHGADTQIVMSNPEASKILALTAEQMLGKESVDPRWTFISKEMSPLSIDEFPVNKVVSTMDPISNYEVGVICPERDSITWVMVNAVPLLNNSGKLEKIVVNFVDITKRVTLEKSLRQEKQRAESALDRAVAANAAKSQFIANMSHEIRTPMNAIMGMTEIVREELDDPILKKYLDKSYQSSEQLLQIINSILDFSKMEADNVTLCESQFDPKKSVKAVIDMLSHSAKKKGLVLKYEHMGILPDTLIGDVDKLTQILINLVGNAIKFTNKGNITLSLKQVPTVGFELDELVTMSVSVSDTGIGIDENQLKHVFEAFTQADETTSRSFGGTGLGLAISSHLVQLMGGNLNVQSVPGKGSVFSFELPFKTPPKSRAVEAVSTIQPEINDSILVGKRVLLVEDAEENQMVISAYLRKTGVQLSIANDGQEAIEMFRPGAFDLILMDINMPRLDGHQATQAIRAMESDTYTPIMALTALARESDSQKCYDSGMDSFLSKPVQKKVLIITMIETLTLDK